MLEIGKSDGEFRRKVRTGDKDLGIRRILVLCEPGGRGCKYGMARKTVQTKKKRGLRARSVSIRNW